MKKIIILLLTVLLCAVTLPFSYAAYDIPYAATNISAMLDISAATQNLRGEGYTWINPENTLTLSGAVIDTDEMYGIKLPKGVTVILKGENIIRGNRAAIGVAGNVTFKGDGTLTLASDTGHGIYCYSESATDTLRLTSGSYNFYTGGDAVSSPSAAVFVSGCTFAVYEAARAFSGRALQLSAGSVSSSAPFEATAELLVSGCSLDVSASGPAFVSGGTLTLRDMDMTCDGKAVAEYAGESSLTAKAIKKAGETSIIYGKNVPALFDYLTIGAIAVVLAAFIAVPAVILRRKNKKLKERYPDRL